ncbi:MAG: DUF2442 domain-containing protein [Oscillospiraceae bacterium]|jgi:hypothetical protein|nr:DUF2442 domain-containing protein [Oscillospiraceae bacterium]
MLQPKILKVNPLTDYKVMVAFDTGEQKIFDVMPYISGDWFGQLRDAEFFKTVHIAGNTIQWAGGQDIAPHELYDCSVPV